MRCGAFHRVEGTLCLVRHGQAALSGSKTKAPGFAGGYLLSTIPGHLVQDRHRSLGNSRFGFVWARRKAEVKLGLGLKLDLEVELRSVQCFPTRNPRSAGRLRKRRVATQL